jgi:membrane protein YqaA with SNARE-associated domain
MWGFEFGYLGLFVSSFLAATVIPFASEAVLAGMLLAGYDPIVSVTLASIGNWLGGMTSYFLGYLGRWQWIEKYLRVSEKRVNKMKSWADQFGAYLGLVCWLPIIGDIISIGLGVFRVHPYYVAIYMLAGKVLRYIAVAYITLEVAA